MADDRSLFERLDDIEAQNSETQRLISSLINKPQTSPQNSGPQNQQQAFENFVRGAQKSWMWFGSSSEFKKSKLLPIISLLTLIGTNIAATILTAINCNMYSAFSLFGNVWTIIGFVYLIFILNARWKFECEFMSRTTPLKYSTDNVGLRIPGREKLIFRILRWFAIGNTLLNIIAIWAFRSNISWLATILEVLFLAAIIFAWIANRYFYSGYSIIYVEGRDNNGRRAAFVHMPGSKGLMSEEQFQKTFGSFFK